MNILQALQKRNENKLEQLHYFFKILIVVSCLQSVIIFT